MHRRYLLKLISILPLTVFLPSALLAGAKKGPKNLLSEKDSLAGAMQYKHDANKAPARTNKKAACNVCAKYNVCMAGDKTCKPLSAAALKKSKTAPCQIFKGKVVNKDGWCLSWEAKA